MQSPFLSHDLHAEFPDLAALVHDLKVSNTHFAHLLDRYGSVDDEIVKSEEGLVVLDDFALEDLKKRRLKLKDGLYRMLRAA